MPREAGPVTAEAVLDYCDRHGIHARLERPSDRIAIPNPSRPGWVLWFVPRPERAMATFAYACPAMVPAARIEAVAQAMNLLNARTYLGVWVVSPDNGELYFRHTVHTTGLRLDDAGLRGLMQLVVGTVEVGMPKLQRVVDGEPPDVVLEAMG